MKKKQIILIVLLATLYGCTKQLDEGPLYFKINGISHYPVVKNAYAEYNCGLRTYEITAYEGDRFYKINFTDIDTLQPGCFIGEDPPTNSTPHSASFWYSNEGYTYTAMPFAIIVHSYKNCWVKATFQGGNVTEGCLNLRVKES